MIFFAEFPVRRILKLFAGLFREKIASEGPQYAFDRYKMAKNSRKLSVIQGNRDLKRKNSRKRAKKAISRE